MTLPLLLCLFLFSCCKCPEKEFQLGEDEILLIGGEITGDEYRKLLEYREAIKKMKSL